MRCLPLLLSLLCALPVQAAGLPNFSSSFEVITFGATIGTAHKTLHCKQQHCTLTGKAEPEGLAKLFTNKKLWEQSQFTIQDNKLIWHKYLKKKYEDDALEQSVTLIRNTDHVLYVEGKRRFPLNTPIFDALSLPFAISLMQQTGSFPKTLYLQDNNWQDKLSFTEIAQKTTLNGQPTLRFKLQGSHIRAELQLQAKAPYLPVLIDIYNKKHKRHIILKQKREASDAIE